MTRYPAGEPCAVRIDCPFEKPGWRAREDGSTVRATFPGTAIAFEGDWYEVRRAEPLAADRVAYFLDPWDGDFPLRAPVTYDAAACAAWARDRRERLRRERLEAPALLAAPILGLAAAALQRRVESQSGIRATTLTAISAASVLAVAGPLAALSSVAALAAAFGASDAALEAIASWRPLWWLLAAESTLRLVSVMSGGEAMGSLLGLPLLLHPRLRRIVREGALATSPPVAPPAVTAAERTERRRAAAQTWVDTLRPLWGLLDGELQARLTRVFRFDAAAATREAAVGTAVTGSAAAFLALRYLLAGGTLADALMLGFGSALLVDTVWWRRRVPGKLAPSLIEPLVRPFALRLLRDLPEREASDSRVAR